MATSIQPPESNRSAKAPAATPPPGAKSFSFPESSKHPPLVYGAGRLAPKGAYRGRDPPLLAGLLPLLDDLLQLALERVYGLLRGDVAPERGVELLGQLQ